MDAILRKECGVNPEILDFDNYCKLYAEWKFVEKVKYENQKAAILDAASEILKAIFPKKNGFSNY
jgi:hypothetical protein